MQHKWLELYKSKLKSMEEAAGLIRDGEIVCSAFGNGQAIGFYDAIGKRVLKGDLHQPSILGANMVRENSLTDPALVGKVNYDSIFVGPIERPWIARGHFTYTPAKYCDMDAISERGLRPAQVSVLRVSPMDRHGFFSMGANVDYGWGLAKNNPSRRLLIVEVNQHVPRTYGNNQLHISEVDVIVEHHEPLGSPPAYPLTPEYDAIAQYVADMVPNGATLQLGVGGIPNAVGLYLKDKRDLGVHTEMIPDSMVDLYEAGVITCSKKTFMPYKWVAAFAWGSQRLYDFVHENPMVEMYSCGFVNNPRIIAENDNMISVNSTLQIDLTGQCASEAIGPSQHSAPGGQLDFVQGAWLSKGGKSFLTLESTFTDKSGVRRSKIVPSLYPGSFVTTPRTEVHWVVTEYGAVLLKGQSIKTRVELLISIAHPDFRDELRFEAKRMGFI